MNVTIQMLMEVAVLLLPSVENAACTDEIPVRVGTGPTTVVGQAGLKDGVRWTSSFVIDGCAADAVASASQQAVLTDSGTVLLLLYDKLVPAAEYKSFLPTDTLPLGEAPKLDGVAPASVTRIQSPELAATWLATWNTPKGRVVGTFALPNTGGPRILFSINERLVSARARASSPDTSRMTITTVTRPRNGTAKISYYDWR